MTPETLEVIEAPEAVATETTQATDPDPQTPNPVSLTEQEAIGVAVEGLRELIKLNYHFCYRMEFMLGTRLPPAIKREQAQRLRYEAAIRTLEGLAWWEGNEALIK